ncbi:MAG TPA: NAD(P)H-hydrate epimerase [Candidatus Dormibacteraeota bacterium]|nr:NAD(P)H-hydrate epimerase [Candidatus Dormibacteraeota bacterium]
MTGGRTASGDQARALDAAAGRSGVSTDALMAIAGFQCARLARTLLEAMPAPSRVAVLAGRGNNGGDALGCARHLAAWGTLVRAVALGDFSNPESSYCRQARAAEAAGVELRPAGSDAASAIDWALEGAALIVDGLLGTGGSGPVRGAVADAIERVNQSASVVLAIDLPSGLDATSGKTDGPCVRAGVTLMLGIPKSGCLVKRTGDLVGRLWLADIGVPAAAYREAGLLPPHFRSGSLEPFEPVIERDST